MVNECIAQKINALLKSVENVMLLNINSIYYANRLQQEKLPGTDSIYGKAKQRTQALSKVRAMNFLDRRFYCTCGLFRSLLSVGSLSAAASIVAKRCKTGL